MTSMREHVAARGTPGAELDAMHRRRPRALLAGETVLAVEAVLLARLTAMVLLDPRVLTDPTVMPPVIASAGLGTAQGLFALAGPLVIILLTLASTRRPARVPWSRTHLALAWVAIGFAAWPIASVDAAASILILGAPAAVLVGAPSSLAYLRRSVGQPPESRWTTRRRVATMLIAGAVAAFIVGYVILAFLDMVHRFPDAVGPARWFGGSWFNH